jgi:hypothetical protein
MCKNLLLVLLPVFITTLSFSQVRFGLKAGWNYSSAYVKTPSGSKPDVKGGQGFHLGAQLKVPFEVKLFFVPQLQYSYKSFNIKYINADTFSNKLSYHYAEIPLLFQLDAREDHLGWFFQFGPSFSLAMKGTDEVKKINGNTSSRSTKFAFNAYGRLEANAVLNAGYRFRNNMAITGGYALGMGSVVDDDFGPVIKPRMFTVSLHYWPGK